MTTVSARLLMPSVMKTASEISSNRGTQLGPAISPATKFAMDSTRPTSPMASANVSPPPKSSRISQGNRSVSDQCSKALLASVGPGETSASGLRATTPEGMRNNKTPETTAIPVSLMGKPVQPTRTSRKIQAQAVPAKTQATRFCAALQSPRPCRISCSHSSPGPPPSAPSGKRNITRVSRKWVRNKTNAATGTATIIQSKKGISTPCVSANMPAMATFGGVPISVAMPPMLAA